MGVCTREWNSMTAGALMATPCTNSLGGESGGHKHAGCGGRRLCLVQSGRRLVILSDQLQFQFLYPQARSPPAWSEPKKNRG